MKTNSMSEYYPLVVHRESVPFFNKEYTVWCVELNNKKYLRYWERDNNLMIGQIDLPNIDWESIIVTIPEILYTELL